MPRKTGKRKAAWEVTIDSVPYLCDKIRCLREKSEQLTRELYREQVECLRLEKILQMEESKDISKLVRNSPQKNFTPTSRIEKLKENCTLFEDRVVQSILGLEVTLGKNDEYLLEFLNHDNLPSSHSALVRLKRKNDGSYQVIHSVVPNVIPVTDLEEEFLRNHEGASDFVNSIYRHWFAFCSKDMITKRIEREEGKGLLMIYNRDLTSFTFIVEFGETKVEITCTFQQCSLSPSDLNLVLLNAEESHSTRRLWNELLKDVSEKNLYGTWKAIKRRITEYGALDEDEEEYDEPESADRSDSGDTEIFNL